MTTLFPIVNNRSPWPPTTNFNQMLAMRVFVRVVEAGTFTKAADSLRMPKPTVTKLVQGLESHLRIKLLNRTTRRVTVTPDGSAYYERVVRLLGDLEDIESSRHACEGEAARPAAHRRGRGASRRTSSCPRCRISSRGIPTSRVECGVSDRPADLIGDNVDCVIRGGPLAGTLARRAAHRRPALADVRHAGLSRKARQAHASDRSRVRPRARRVYFFPRSGRMRPLAFERDGKRIEIPPAPRVAVNDSRRAFRVAARGPGPRPGPVVHRVGERRRSKELVPVLEDWQPAPLPCTRSTRPTGICRPRCACSSTGPRNCFRAARARACHYPTA